MRRQFKIVCNRCDEEIIKFNMSDKMVGGVVAMRRHQEICKGAPE